MGPHGYCSNCGRDLANVVAIVNKMKDMKLVDHDNPLELSKLIPESQQNLLGNELYQLFNELCLQECCRSDIGTFRNFTTKIYQ